MTLFRKTNRSARKSIIALRGNSRSSTKTLMEKKKKKHILLVDGTSDWLRIWMAASSLDIKGNKAILANQWFSQIRSQIVSNTKTRGMKSTKVLTLSSVCKQNYCNR